MGLVRGANALSQEYIENSVVKQYIDNPKMTIILFENPPYAETTSIEHQKMKVGKSSSSWKNNYVVQKMKEDVGGTVVNDLGNAFIWSAFKYYLRQPTDSYIVYSPVKYWKAQHLINKNFLDGFAFNRKHFHTNIEACIMVALWSNEDVRNLDTVNIHAFNIADDNIIDDGYLPVNKVYSTYSNKFFDKRTFNDDIKSGILSELNGTEKNTLSGSLNPITNYNIVGYMAVYSSGFDNPDLHSSLLRVARYDGHGFYLRNDNFLEKLPMFAASRYITYNRRWTERARIMKSGDGADKYFKDIKSVKLDNYLLQVLLFTILEMQNHMRSFTGSDGVFYKNELCLDISNGATLASRTLEKLVPYQEEQELLNQWQAVLDCAKKAKNYQKDLNYGVYQIFAELNTFTEDPDTGKRIYDYPELNGNLTTLKAMVKHYYLETIVPTLFEYQFLK